MVNNMWRVVNNESDKPMRKNFDSKKDAEEYRQKLNNPRIHSIRRYDASSKDLDYAYMNDSVVTGWPGSGKISNIRRNADGTVRQVKITLQDGTKSPWLNANSVQIDRTYNSQFSPHMMYDPKTGEGYYAERKEDHLKWKGMGYTHSPMKYSKKKTGMNCGCGQNPCRTYGRNKKGQTKDYFRGNKDAVGLKRLDGNNFFLESVYKTKVSARSQLNRIKKETGGYVNARVVKNRNGWGVYTALSKKFKKENLR